MEIKTLSLGPFQTNCYVVISGNDVVVIDPAAKGEKIADAISSEMQVHAILLTHGHFDHFGGAEYLAKKYQCPIYVHPEDAIMLEDPKLNYSMKANLRLSQNVVLLNDETLRFGPFLISVVPTPGHSEGSVCYHLDHLLFSGDLLFKAGIGRTDLYRGNHSKIMRSLTEIMHLSDDVIVYPGHGPKTSIGHERKTNPFLK